MIEINPEDWPHLTDGQRNLVGFVAERADTDIPSSPYVVGTFEMSDEAVDLLTKFVIYRLSIYDYGLSEASIMLLAHDRTLLTYTPVSVRYKIEEGDEDPPFLTSVGNYGDEFFYETDEQMQARLNKLAMLEQSGVLKRIVTDPKDHT